MILSLILSLSKYLLTKKPFVMILLAEVKPLMGLSRKSANVAVLIKLKENFKEVESQGQCPLTKELLTMW